MSEYDIPEKQLSVYTCAFTKRIEVEHIGMEPVVQRVRVCDSPGEFLCNRKRGHAYCEHHYNPKTSREEMSRKKIEKERDEQGERDVEAFEAEAKRLREELAGNAEQRKKSGLLRKEVEEKEEFVSGVILL